MSHIEVRGGRRGGKTAYAVKVKVQYESCTLYCSIDTKCFLCGRKVKAWTLHQCSAPAPKAGKK